MIKLADKKTIDDLVGLKGRKFIPVDVFRFSYRKFVRGATDYSAVRGLSKESMVFDAKVKRLEDNYGYLKALLTYAKENFATTSRVKQKEIYNAGIYLRAELETLMKGSHLSRQYSDKGRRIKVGEKPESYKNDGNYIHMVPATKK
jgi:hypothetical protein